MKTPIIVFLLVVAFLPAAAQELLLDRLSIDQVIHRELTMGSIQDDSIVQWMPADYHSWPLLFRRTTGAFKPHATVLYHYSNADSLPFRIEYNWDTNAHRNRNHSFDPAPDIIEPMSRLAEYNAHYESLKAEVVREYGHPSFSSESPTRHRTDRGHYLWSRSDHWNRKGMWIALSMTFADSSAPGTYQIGVRQMWGEKAE